MMEEQPQLAVKLALSSIIIGLLVVLISCQSTEKANYLQEVKKSKEFVQSRFNNLTAQSDKRLDLLNQLFSLTLTEIDQTIDSTLSRLKKEKNEVNNIRLKENAIIHSQLEQETLSRYIRLQENITGELIALHSLVKHNNKAMSQPALNELLLKLEKVNKRISIEARKFSYQLIRHNESYPNDKIPLIYSIKNSVFDKITA